MTDFQPGDIRERHKASEAFVEANLKALAAEVVQWQATGILADGMLRDLARSMTYLSSSDRLSVAEALVSAAALRAIAAT